MTFSGILSQLSAFLPFGEYEKETNDRKSGAGTVGAIQKKTESYSFSFGSHKIGKEEVCGDEVASFEANGKKYALISDGMGTGKGANALAKRLCVILQSLILNGIEPETALGICAEIFGGLQADESFATVDLLEFSPEKGLCFYKCGGSKSYVFCNGKIHALPGGGYPFGIVEPFALKIELECFEGEIVMCSDGGEGVGGFKLWEMISKGELLDCDRLAEEICTYAKCLQTEKSSDDISVVVIKIEKIKNYSNSA